MPSAAGLTKNSPVVKLAARGRDLATVGLLDGHSIQLPFKFFIFVLID